MTEVLIGLVIGIVGLMGFVFFKMMKAKKENPEGKVEKEKFTPTSQDQLAFDYIRSGIVKLKSGGYRLLIELPSVNIELMEPQEKEVVLQQYRQILNAMDFPFQYLQQSRIVDIAEYLTSLEGFARKEQNPLIKKQVEFYSEFLIDLIRDRSVLTKKFYLVIPYDEDKETKNKSGYYAEVQKKKAKEKAKAEIKAGGKTKKKERDETPEENEVYIEEKRFEKARKMLYGRGAMVERAFRRFDIAPNILDDQELLELFYTAYNKDRSVIQSLRNTKISDQTSLRVKAQRRERNEI